MASVWGIVVAGGQGNRFQSGQRPVNKLLLPLAGKPVIWHSINALLATQALEGLVMVVHPNHEAAYRDALLPFIAACDWRWCPGGVTRRDSVAAGLAQIPETADVILIHDAARPLVAPEAIQSALQPIVSGAALGTSLGCPLVPSVKAVQSSDAPWVTQSLMRETIWQVHTPQVFQAKALRHAHVTIPASAVVTDDAELVERAYPEQPAVLMVLDQPDNLKLTTETDYDMVKVLFANRQTNGSPVSPPV